MADVFYYVQHLLGIGHVRRSVAIANSIARNNMQVHFISGGNAVPDLGLDSHIEFTQLPPIRARDGDFGDLVDGDNIPPDLGLGRIGGVVGEDAIVVGLDLDAVDVVFPKFTAGVADA